MLSITVTGNGLVRFHEAVRALGEAKAKRAYAMALNKTASKVRTQVKREIAAQMGVSQANVIKHGGLKVIPANAGNLEASVNASGKHLPVKDFKPAQRKKGASANPWNKRHIFPGTFINFSGKAGGHVFRRNGKFNKVSRRFNAIEALWGPAVPKEMVKDESAKAFHRIYESEMPIEVERAIALVTRGAVSKGE